MVRGRGNSQLLLSSGNSGEVDRLHIVSKLLDQSIRESRAESRVTNMDRDDVGRGVLHRQSSSHQLLPQVFHIIPVPGTEHPAFLRSQNLDGGNSSAQNSWRKRSGEDESSSITTDNINQALGGRNIPAYIAKCLPECQR